MYQSDILGTQLFFLRKPPFSWWLCKTHTHTLNTNSNGFIALFAWIRIQHFVTFFLLYIGFLHVMGGFMISTQHPFSTNIPFNFPLLLSAELLWNTQNNTTTKIIIRFHFPISLVFPILNWFHFISFHFGFICLSLFEFWFYFLSWQIKTIIFAFYSYWTHSFSLFWSGIGYSLAKKNSLTLYFSISHDEIKR